MDRLVLNRGIVLQIRKVVDAIFAPQIDIAIIIGNDQRMRRGMIAQCLDFIITQSVLARISSEALILFTVDIKRTIRHGKDVIVCLLNHFRCPISPEDFPFIELGKSG